MHWSWALNLFEHVWCDGEGAGHCWALRMVQQGQRTKSHHINSGFPQVVEMGLLKLDNAYKFPNVRCRGWACRTNLPSNTALRGFGFPQAGLITEACITDVAAQCGLSPEEVRLNQSHTQKTPTFQGRRATEGHSCWGGRGLLVLSDSPWVTQLTRDPKFRDPCSTQGASQKSWGQDKGGREWETSVILSTINKKFIKRFI